MTTVINIVLLLVVVGLICYLIVSLLDPERF